MKIVDKAKMVSQKSTPVKNESIYDIQINSLNGNPINLGDYKEKFILFVNVASKCGFTKQYSELQKLSDYYSNKLVVIGSPCNQFGSQEPSGASEIQSFCERNFGVTFLLTEKIEVKGNKQHPLYKWLTTKSINNKKSSSVKWNFQKYLVDDKGVLIDYFYSITKPMSPKITKNL